MSVPKSFSMNFQSLSGVGGNGGGGRDSVMGGGLGLASSSSGGALSNVSASSSTSAVLHDTSIRILTRLHQAQLDKDANFMECMNLSSMERNIGLFIGDYRLSDVFAMLATEERKHADLIFKWLFSSGGLQILLDIGFFDERFGESDEEYESDSEVDHGQQHSLPEEFLPPNQQRTNIRRLSMPYASTRRQSSCSSSGGGMGPVQQHTPLFNPLVALQGIMQQRANHIAYLLELKSMAEKSKRHSGSKGLNLGGHHHDIVSSFLQFLKVNERGLFCGSQDTDKRAREAILCLEKQRKEKQFLPVSEF